jgi:hypothetical protein
MLLMRKAQVVRPRTIATASLAAALLSLSACSESPNAPDERTSTARPRFDEALALSTTTFVSDPSWLPASQNVCLNASSPSPCPAGATLYDYAGSGWGANLSAIPGATWIWGAGVTGATTPAFPGEFTFSKTFTITGVPAGGSTSIAADDFAAVLVNGALVGTIGSRTDGALAGASSSSLHTFDIGPFLVTGLNVITIQAANGNFGCGSGPYSCNPAGVVFGGSFSFQADPLTKDDCKDGGWEVYGFRNQGQCVRFIETGGDSR